MILFQALTGSSNSVGNLLDAISIVSNTNDGITCLPEDITVQCDAIPMPAEVSAMDDCDETMDVTFTENTLGEICNQQIIRTWSATDNCGNKVSASQIYAF